MLVSFIVQLVDFSRRFAWLVILFFLIAAGGCGFFAATHFKITTDINQLLASDLPWRVQERALDTAFPQNVDQTVVVIDGSTPEIAEAAASALASRMQERTDRFTRVTRPDSIPFFRTNGLLFLSKDKVTALLDQLVQAQPMFGMVATDPSLRGFFNLIGLMLQGLQHGATDYDHLDQPFSSIADTLDAALNGQDKPIALDSMGGSSEKPTIRDLRKFILANPVLDYSALEPGSVADQTIRDLATELKLTKENGVTIRLTGSVPLNDEEFGSVSSGTGTATIASGVLVFVLLLLALRSLKIVLPIILTLIVGLMLTTAFALAAVGSLNLISVAFAVMFIGIAVDFSIQFGVRYRDQRHQEPLLSKALSRTAAIIAVPLSMAAGSTALGFFAFIPTAYRGVSELGLIAGAGMLIAFFLNITFLPALLTLINPPPEKEAVGYRWAAPVDTFLLRHRRALLAVALVVAVAGAAIVSQITFDFDPLNLKDKHTESVSTLFDIMQDPDSGFYKIGILKPSLAEAQNLAAELGKLPEVDHVMTLASFVPDDQDAKLSAIADAASLLQPTLAMTALSPPQGDDEIYAAMTHVSIGLHAIEGAHSSAARLAKAIDDVIARHDHSLLVRLQANIIAVLQSKLDMAKAVLAPARVTTDAITDDLKQDWVTSDGRYLVQAYPKGSATDRKALVAFTNAVRKVAPDAAGAPISIQESGNTIIGAFIHAGCYAIVAIAVLGFLVLRRVRDVALLLTPLILAGILTLATMVLFDMPLNFANIIALPLLLSLGVSYGIYFVSYWHSGLEHPLQSSMARAVFFSAATVLVAFGSLALSSHPGTAGMGKLLTLALLYSLGCTFFILPSLLGPNKPDKD